MYASSDALWMVGVAFPLAASMAAPSTLMDARACSSRRDACACSYLGLERQAIGRRGRVRGGVGAVVRRANDERVGAVAAGAEGGGTTRESARPRARWRAIPRFPSSCRRARVPRASPASSR